MPQYLKKVFINMKYQEDVCRMPTLLVDLPITSLLK